MQKQMFRFWCFFEYIVLKYFFLSSPKDIYWCFMSSHSYDVIFTGGKDAILERFDKLNAQVVFAAEDYCWPNKNLASQYPRVAFGYKYLNSGGNNVFLVKMLIILYNIWWVIVSGIFLLLIFMVSILNNIFFL